MSGIWGQLRWDRTTQLQNHLAQHEGLFKRLTKQTDPAIRACYMVSETD
jgi:hypothetical protein